LQPGHVTVRLRGSAGQSLGAFAVQGLKLEVFGDANDYVGKGLSGATIVVRPAPSSSLVSQQNTIIGNTVLYGATSGFLFAAGQGGERFAVRNSGATAVVEGVGDHGCEYMTKGLVICLSDTGKNFAAGMTGGFAYVLDENSEFQKTRCNRESVDLERVDEPEDIENLRRWIVRHAEATGSPRANWILDKWHFMLPKFVKVFPHEYRRVLGIARSKEAVHG
jgi:glutamate synthase domain-containing protein 3